LIYFFACFCIFAANMKRIFFITALLLLLSACVTTHKVNYLQEPGKGIPAYEQAAPPDDYRLQVGDKINVYLYSLDKEANSFFNRSSSSSTGGESVSESSSYIIYADSCVHYPVLGDVKVAGKTAREAALVFKEKLFGSVIKEDFNIRITLVNDYCYVVGETNSRQVALPNRQTTIFQVLSSEPGDYADRGHVKVFRQLGGGATVMKEFDLRSKDLLHSEFYYVQPNDVIYVRSFKGQFFKIGAFTTMLSTILSVISFGTFIYGISTRF